MFKGIRLIFIFTLLFVFTSLSAFAATDAEIGGTAYRACKSLPGASTSVEREPLVEDGDYIKECAKVRCSISSSGAGGVTVSQVKAAFPNASDNGGIIAGWKRVCKQHKRTNDDDFVVDVDTDVDTDVDVDVDGRGGGGFYIDGVLVSKSEWLRRCVKKSGKIRRKCRRGNSGYDDYYYDSDVYVRGGGGGRGRGGYDGYVVIRKADGSTFNCQYTSSWDDCLRRGGEGSVVISTQTYDDHCVNCEGRRRGGGTLSGIAEIAGAILPPLAHLGSNWLWADAYLGSNQAWAGAAQVGFEQCQLMQTNHIQSMYGNGTTDMRGYFSNNELPFEYIAPPGCNGYNVNGFAGGMGFMGNGMGGFGHPWMGAGYSPGFVGGMYGPYGQYNPYGMGGIGMGGFPGMGGGIGVNLGLGMGGLGGMYPGMGGMGGFPGGGIGGGIGGMYPGMGGMGGMYPGMGGMGGFPGGGIGGGIGGMGGMYPGMGGMGGMYPGMGGMGGFPGGGIGVGINGGIGGMGGFPGGGIGINGGIGGGYHGNPWGAGAGGMGTVPWGNGAGSYWNGSGGWNGGGGWGNQYGANFGNIQQSYALNQQAVAQGSYYQQAALQNSYNQSAQNLWSVGYGGGMGMGAGGYGYAPYSPSNMGLSMNLGWGFGF